MNILRLIAIALPITLLLACGGGGGGGGGVAAPTTMMPGTDDPNMPDPMTTPDPDMPPIVALPGYAITDLDAARNAFSGSTAPTITSETAIVSAIQTRATAADTFEFSDFVGTPDVDITCPNNFSCSGNVPDVGMLTFSLAGIDDLSLVDDTGLVGFVSNSQAVMTYQGVTTIQSQAAAGQNDGTHLTFQTFGGWLTNTVFGVERLDVLEDGATTTRYASFSFGNNSGTNPPLAQYEGVMSGTNTQGQIFQGDATIALTRANRIRIISFLNIKDIKTQSSIPRMDWSDIAITDGAFQSVDGSISGNFYGNSHTEVGGIFNRNNIIGAFGAKK